MKTSRRLLLHVAFLIIVASLSTAIFVLAERWLHPSRPPIGRNVIVANFHTAPKIILTHSSGASGDRWVLSC